MFLCLLFGQEHMSFFFERKLPLINRKFYLMDN